MNRSNQNWVNSDIIRICTGRVRSNVIKFGSNMAKIWVHIIFSHIERVYIKSSNIICDHITDLLDLMDPYYGYGFNGYIITLYGYN